VKNLIVLFVGIVTLPLRLAFFRWLLLRGFWFCAPASHGRQWSGLQT